MAPSYARSSLSQGGFADPIIDPDENPDPIIDSHEDADPIKDSDEDADPIKDSHEDADPIEDSHEDSGEGGGKRLCVDCEGDHEDNWEDDVETDDREA